MGTRIIGFAFYGTVITRKRRLRLSDVPQEIAAVVVRLRKRGLKRNGAVIAGECLVNIVEVTKGVTAVVVGLSVAVVKGKGAVEAIYSIVQTAQIMQGVGSVIVGFCRVQAPVPAHGHSSATILQAAPCHGTQCRDC